MVTVAALDTSSVGVMLALVFWLCFIARRHMHSLGNLLIMMKYRADIDGLRAIAVLAVLLFHAKFQLFSGGFVGVDVFFVISGYLITSLIVAELSTTGFSIVRFYERRIRRILPALFVVVGFSSIVSYQIFTPDDLKDFGPSAIAATLFSSNVLFWLRSGYFDAPADQVPLLHTWSLAVEEQFYIVFPILLLLIFRFARSRWSAFIIPIAIVSIGISVWGVRYYPTASFYLAPTRAWELMLGAVLATGLLPPMINQRYREGSYAIGLGLIAFSIFAFSRETPFPGEAALLPCLGAALIVHAGSGGTSLFGRFLSAKPIVFIGLISYSLYLWHWPLIVFFRYYVARELTPAEAAGVLILSVAVAALSWRFIETPFRGQGGWFGRKTLFASTGVVACSICIVGLAIYLGDGYTLRFNFTNTRPVGKETYNTGTCLLHGDQPVKEYRARDCTFGDAGASRAVILWGDSHAAHWIRSVSGMANNYKVAVIQANVAGCAPLIGNFADNLSPKKRNCLDFNENIRSFIEADENIVGVILAANWSMYEADNSFLEHLTETLEILKGRGLPVLIVGQVPTFAANVPVIHRQKIRDGEAADRAVSSNIATSQMNTFLAGAARDDLFVYLPHSRLCKGDICRIAVDDSLLYWDSSHLSVFGSDYLIDGFKEYFSSLATAH